MGKKYKLKEAQGTTDKENHKSNLKTNFKAKSKAFAKAGGTPVQSNKNTPKSDRPAASKTSNKASPREPPVVGAVASNTKKNTQVTAKPSKSPVPTKSPVNSGNGIDRIDQQTGKPSGMKNGTDPRNAVPPKKRPPPAPFSSSTGWVVEDAEVALRYSDSEEESGTAAKKRKSNGVAGDAQRNVVLAKYNGDTYDQESDYDSEDYESTEEGTSVSDEQSSDDDSEQWTDMDEYDDDDDDDSSYSEDSVQRHLYHDYEDESETDEDYVPSSADEDLYIPRGAGKVYDCDDDTIEFENDEPQIIELPPDYGTPSKQDEDEEEEATTESDASDSCPSLVPIYNEKGEMIDDVKLLPGKGVHEEEPVAEQRASSDDETLPIDESGEEASDGLENYHFYDAIDRHMSLVMMKKPLHLTGHVSVQALFGKVEIMGYTLDKAEKRTVYAARGYNAVNLTPIPDPETFQRPAFEAILQKLKSQFTRRTIDELLKLFNPTDYVLLLLDAELEKRNTTVRIVHRYLEEYDLFPASNTTTTAPLRATEYWLNVRLLEPRADGSSKLPLFQANPAWSDVILHTDSRLLVLGGKGAGKSTLCQFLLNRSIKTFDRILLIDLDIGQPLLTAPEMISATVLDVPLLGVASFTVAQQPVRCHLFGSLNVVTNPIFFIQNVRSLLEHCENTPSLRGIPWIINTMGYVSGFGEELTAAIMRLVQPTDVIQLSIPGARERGSENYRHAMTAKFIQSYKFNILQNEIVAKMGQVLRYKHYAFDVCFDAQACRLAAPKRRNVGLMVELVKILDEETECFTAVQPVSAPLDDLEILITRDEYQPTKEMLPNVVNATLVYLCEKLEQELYSCLGVGIVRAVDDERNVHLIHSLTPQQLDRVKVLALCNTSLPSQVSLKLQPTMKGTIPYLQNVSVKQLPPAPPAPSALSEEPSPSGH
ncbi:polynucleotide 5'-hydroxyl-kinase NOL9 [Anopheles aquasalis]|uniref:polynucleotide 5'-hydroxyl-kinase NOL9 n=1 Tax=Anopheles aquasalis TaxID=42839 RepID=UPI00215AB92E|nr:polynucleotide 5'-hydroxyl-kinase NOL9 [Anopheles aquasalis]